jgi:hypothetical protein
MSLPPHRSSWTLCALLCLQIPAWPLCVEGDGLKDLVERNCVSCHGALSPEAGLDLLGYDPEDLDTALDMFSRVRSGDMPPVHADGGISSSDRSALLMELAELLRSAPADPGRPTLRRLDREEYESSVTDLLRVDCDVSRDLPMDASSGGFTN